jgi:two-component system sensor histidine kinase SenX3
MRIVLDINDDFSFLVDIELMSSAITNLVDNAIKYGDANTVVRISTGIERSNRVFITVTNIGKSIPKELHEKIFERFFRYDASAGCESSGTGLGLSIVKSIVTLHNGEVKVFSGNGNETSFYIYLSSKDS